MLIFSEFLSNKNFYIEFYINSNNILMSEVITESFLHK